MINPWLQVSPQSRPGVIDFTSSPEADDPSNPVKRKHKFGGPPTKKRKKNIVKLKATNSLENETSIGISRRMRKYATPLFWTQAQVQLITAEFETRYQPDASTHQQDDEANARKVNWVQHSVIKFYIEIIEGKRQVPDVVSSTYIRAKNDEQKIKKLVEQKKAADKPMGLYRRLRKLLKESPEFWEQSEIEKVHKKIKKKITEEKKGEPTNAAIRTHVCKQLMTTAAENEEKVPECFLKVYKKTVRLEKAATKREQIRFANETNIGINARMFKEVESYFWKNSDVLQEFQKLYGDKVELTDQRKNQLIKMFVKNIEQNIGVPTLAQRLYRKAEKYEKQIKQRDLKKLREKQRKLTPKKKPKAKLKLSSHDITIVKRMNQIASNKFWKNPKVQEVLTTYSKRQEPQKETLIHFVSDIKQEDKAPICVKNLYTKAKEAEAKAKEERRLKREAEIRKKKFQVKILSKMGLIPPATEIDKYDYLKHLIVKTI